MGSRGILVGIRIGGADGCSDCVQLLKRTGSGDLTHVNHVGAPLRR
jgi:hypothetical protein